MLDTSRLRGLQLQHGRRSTGALKCPSLPMIKTPTTITTGRSWMVESAKRKETYRGYCGARRKGLLKRAKYLKRPSSRRKINNHKPLDTSSYLTLGPTALSSAKVARRLVQSGGRRGARSQCREINPRGQPLRSWAARKASSTRGT